MSLLGGSKHPPAKGKDDKDDDDDKSSAKSKGTQADKDREGEDKHVSDESRVAGDSKTVKEDRDASDPDKMPPEGQQGTRAWDNVAGTRKAGPQVATGSPTQNEPNARDPMSREVPPQQDPADASTLNHPLTPKVVSYAKLANDSFDEFKQLREEIERTGKSNEANRARVEALFTAFEGKFRNLVDLTMGDNDVPRPI